MVMHARPRAEASHSDLPDLREASTGARAQAALLWPGRMVLVVLVVEMRMRHRCDTGHSIRLLLDFDQRI